MCKTYCYQFFQPFSLSVFFRFLLWLFCRQQCFLGSVWRAGQWGEQMEAKVQLRAGSVSQHQPTHKHTRDWNEPIWLFYQLGCSSVPTKFNFLAENLCTICSAFCVLGVLKLDFRFSPQTVVREVGMDSVGEQKEDPVSLLRQFLAINTSHPHPDYQVLSNSTLTKNLKNFRSQPGGSSIRRKG